MSYDLHLYTKDKESKLIKKDSLKKLDDKFSYVISEEDDKGYVTGFYIEFKDGFNKELPEDNFEVYYQGDDAGYYAIWCTMNREAIGYLIDLVRSMASKLNLLVSDPQTGEEKIEADFL